MTELLSAPPAGAGHGRGARLREVFDQRDGLLLAIGAELLREAKDQPGTRQMIAQLMGRGLLGLVYGALAKDDPGAAGQLTHIASRMDGSVERILKRPQARAGVELGDEEAGLLADWLRVLAGAAGRLLDSGDARARARMALAWGKIAQIERMGEQWLEDPDARVRANAVESLWGRADAEAVEIFRRKLEDAHQRVAANAAVGLYLAGESEAVKALWRMATEGDAARKAAAVWAMGRAGDARFLPLLARMRRMQPAPVLVMRNLAAAKERILHVEEAPRARLSVEAAVVAGRFAGGCQGLARGRDAGAGVAAGGFLPGSEWRGGVGLPGAAQTAAGRCSGVAGGAGRLTRGCGASGKTDRDGGRAVGRPDRGGRRLLGARQCRGAESGRGVGTRRGGRGGRG